MEYQIEKDLSDREFAILQSELSQYSKSTALTYVLWLFVGWIGIHQFYMGKWLRGLLYAGLCFGGWFTIGFTFADPSFSPAPAIMFGALTVFLIVDLFTIPSQLDKMKEHKKEEVLNNLNKQ